MKIPLSDRLQLIAKKVSPNSVIADIGSDHAYLPCYVCLQHENVKAIAGEVSEGPYEKSLETVRKYRLENRIDVRLGNGLEVIKAKDNVSEVIIAGMGGSLISSILKNDSHKLKNVQRLILQPNNNELTLRRTLIQLGFTLTAEYILEENNLIYEIIIAENKAFTKAESPYIDDIKEKQLLFGPYLSKEKTAVFKDKWQQEQKQLKQIIEQMKQSKDEEVQQKIKIFKQQIKWIEEVIS